MKRRSLRCIIRSCRWSDLGIQYGELDCEHCGYSQSLQDPVPFYILRPWEQLRFWFSHSPASYRIKDLWWRIRRRFRAHDPEDDIPF